MFVITQLLLAWCACPKTATFRQQKLREERLVGAENLFAYLMNHIWLNLRQIYISTQRDLEAGKQFRKKLADCKQNGKRWECCCLFLSHLKNLIWNIYLFPGRWRYSWYGFSRSASLAKGLDTSKSLLDNKRNNECNIHLMKLFIEQTEEFHKAAQLTTSN